MLSKKILYDVYWSNNCAIFFLKLSSFKLSNRLVIASSNFALKHSLNEYCAWQHILILNTCCLHQSQVRHRRYVSLCERARHLICTATGRSIRLCLDERVRLKIEVSHFQTISPVYGKQTSAMLCSAQQSQHWRAILGHALNTPSTSALISDSNT